MLPFHKRFPVQVFNKNQISFFLGASASQADDDAQAKLARTVEALQGHLRTRRLGSVRRRRARKRVVLHRRGGQGVSVIELFFSSSLTAGPNKQRHDTQQNDIHYNGTQHNDIHYDTRHNYIHYNGIQHNDLQHNGRVLC